MRSFITLLLLAVACLSTKIEEEDTGPETMIPIINVGCGDMMTVQISTDHSIVFPYITVGNAEALTRANITLGDGCPLIYEAKKKRVRITTPYDSCGIRKYTYNDGQVFKTTLFLSQNESFQVSCSIVKESPKLVGVNYRVSNENEVFNTRGKYIRSYLNAELRFLISPVFASIPNSFPEIYSYPMTCVLHNWGSSLDDPVTVLRDGCPVWDIRKRFFLSAVYQATATSISGETTEVRIVLSNHVIPESDATTPRFQLQCDVFACTGDTKNRIQDLPLCPSVINCNPSNGTQPILKKVGGESVIPAPLETPILVDLTRSGGYGPIREAVPNMFRINGTRHQIRCTHSPSYTMYIVTSVIALVVGFLGGYVLFRFTAARPVSFKAPRCGREMSQASPLPQPYEKLESQPTGILTPDSPESPIARD